jgi:hypothetical protein
MLDRTLRNVMFYCLLLLLLPLLLMTMRRQDSIVLRGGEGVPRAERKRRDVAST